MPGVHCTGFSTIGEDCLRVCYGDGQQPWLQRCQSLGAVVVGYVGYSMKFLVLASCALLRRTAACVVQPLPLMHLVFCAKWRPRCWLQSSQPHRGAVSMALSVAAYLFIGCIGTVSALYRHRKGLVAAHRLLGWL